MNEDKNKAKLKHIRKEKKRMSGGRPKGGKNRYWSKEAQYEYVKLVVSGEISAKELGIQNHVNNGMISKWIKQFCEDRKDALENKRKPGNPLTKYQNRRKFTPLEQLQYENLKRHPQTYS